MPTRSPWLAALTVVTAILQILGTVACDDPVPGPIGGLILTIRSFEATTDPDLIAINTIEIQTARVEVQHRKTLGGDPSFLIVDSQPRTIIIQNGGQTDLLVAQYQVPVGFVSQIRIYPRAVTLHLKNGTDIALGVPSSNLPSWEQSGWKIEPVDGAPWPIYENELTGVRVIFHFDSESSHNKGNGYKLRPNIKAELFSVNPQFGEPGIYYDQLMVDFSLNTPKARIDSINSAIGATVLAAPSLSISNLYLVKLPSSINLQDADIYYSNQSEVLGVLPSISYSLFDLNPSEGTRVCQARASLPQAWEHVRIGGFVGTHKIRVAVIDSGFAIAHPDLYLNIAINEKEIPIHIKALVRDVDVDGVISFIDLNNSQNSAFVPPDFNGNGYIDGLDLIDPRSAWINNNDDDGNGPIDDLVGYNFADKSNNPTTNPAYHGTQVAGIVGAIGNNAFHAAGTIWTVSIVPIQVAKAGSAGSEPKAVEDAIRYVEDLGVDIANISLGGLYVSKTAILNCAKLQKDVLSRPLDSINEANQRMVKFFRREPFHRNGENISRVLYVFAAGNNAANLDDPNYRLLPGQAMRSALGDHALLVGSFDTTTRSSCTESNFGRDVTVFAPGGGYSYLIPPNGVINSGDSDDCATSFAAPMVAGTAALVLTSRPGLSPPSEIYNHIVSTAPIGVSHAACGRQPGDDVYRQLNAYNAVR